MKREHFLTALVEDRPGVMQRMAGMFARRGFNIESITVGKSEQPDISRMTLVVQGGDKVLEQVRKQLEKLVEVIKVTDLDPSESVVRELSLIKVHVPTEKQRSAIINYVNIFRGRIVDVSSESITIEVTGDKNKINALIDLLSDFGIKELARTGLTAMIRGAKSSTER